MVQLFLFSKSFVYITHQADRIMYMASITLSIHNECVIIEDSKSETKLNYSPDFNPVESRRYSSEVKLCNASRDSGRILHSLGNQA